MSQLTTVTKFTKQIASPSFLSVNNMRPFTALFIAAAILLCCYATEVDKPPYPPVYDRVVKCVTRFLYANPSGTNKPVRVLMCDAFKVFMTISWHIKTLVTLKCIVDLISSLRNQTCYIFFL